MVKALPWPLGLGRGEEKGSVGAGAGWDRRPQFEMQKGAVVSACPWSSVLGLQTLSVRDPFASMQTFPPQCAACGT